MKQGDVYRNNHTGLEYVVEVKDIMSHDTPVAKAVKERLLRARLKHSTFVKNIYDKLEEK